MADVEKLLAEFAEELREAGEADPRPYLRQVEGAERRELAALIDACIERAPRRAWDAKAFKASAAGRSVDRLAWVVRPEVEPLAELLPRLRNERKLPRSQLASRLAAALGFSDREPKVAHYYHQLEQGLLPPTGVSGRVFEALGTILEESVAHLRAAGRGLAESAGPPADEVFARTAAPEPASGKAITFGDRSTPEDEWDEVDELFRGGD